MGPVGERTRARYCYSRRRGRARTGGEVPISHCSNRPACPVPRVNRKLLYAEAALAAMRLAADPPEIPDLEAQNMTNQSRVWRVGVVVTLALAGGTWARGQQVLQHNFEGRDPLWVAGPNDAQCKETLHKLTDESAHNGQRSETIQFAAQPGSFIHYTYDVGRAP